MRDERLNKELYTALVMNDSGINRQDVHVISYSFAVY